MQQAFSEVENTDPAQHQRWLDKHGFKPDAEGRFAIDAFEGREPVTVEKLFENIRANVSIGDYIPLYTKPYDDRIFVMICGGPSLADHLDEIRAKALDRDHYMVVCSNMTGGYLLEHGITPHVHFILDPQEKKKFDVLPHRTSGDTEYWLNVACDPAVFGELREQGIKPHVFLADFEAGGRAIKAVKDAMTYGQDGMMAIQGGTMAGLRAINLADALGFRKMEYYGFDATVKVSDGRAQPYAYDKKRGEAIIEISCDRCDAKFDSTLIFQKQVNEFLQWRSHMPWMDMSIIGGGLIAHYVDHVLALESQVVRAKYRYTPEYAELQKTLHSEGDYGVSGSAFAPTIFHAVSQLAKKHGEVSILDYGSAGGKTLKSVQEKFWLPPGITCACYDPFIEEFSAEPEPADFVICTDVLEHVEPECIYAVLDHLAAITKKIIFLSISLSEAHKKLADGRNAHINLRNSEFWMREIKKRFIPCEAKEQGDADLTLLVVAQSIEGVKNTLREQANERS